MKLPLGIITSMLLMAVVTGCGASKNKSASVEGDSDVTVIDRNVPIFDADSAYEAVRWQVELGPRVPNTEAHRLAGDRMANLLSRYGAEVKEQRADLKAFDGTVIHARNIFGMFNPEASDRTLLVAHYDCRPWADEDPDPAKRHNPVDGANDGASGVAVLLETARQIGLNNPGKGIDILFVDAEDWGTEGNDESWAMGTRYFVNNPILPGYIPARVILTDMVGGAGASFPVEYFSYQAAPEMVNQWHNASVAAGYGDLFPQTMGGAVTDDHVEFIKAGIPAIDIIEYHPQSGFNPHWHTSSDNLSNISKETLKAVGQTLLEFIY